MNMKEIPDAIKNFPGKDLLAGRSQDRIHLSQIYTDLERELYPQRNFSSGNDLYWETGFLFEEALQVALGNRLGVRVGEIELDGIVMSPDGVDFGKMRLEEYKCTWKSIKTTPDLVWRWQTQVKGYLKALELRECLFRVLYLVGDYKGSGPIYKEFLLFYEQSELDANWEMLVKHAQRKGWLTIK